MKYLLHHILLGSIVLACAACSKVPQDLQRAEELLKSRPAEALEILDASPSRDASRMGDKALWELLDVWARYNNYEKVLPVGELDDACGYFLKRHDHLRRAQAYYVRASVYADQRLGGDAQIMDDLQRGCHEVEKCSDHNLGALLWQHYGASLNSRKWTTEAIAALEKSCEHARKAGMTAHRITSTINIANAYLYLGDETRDYSRATEYAQAACALADSVDNRDQYSRALNCLALCHSRAGRFPQALECSRQSVKIQEQMLAEGKRKERVRYVSLADAWRKMENADSCIFYALRDYDHPSIVARINATQQLYCAYRDILHDDAMAAKYMTENNQLTLEQEKLRENGKVASGQVAFEKEIQEKRQTNIILTVLLALLVIAMSFVLVLRLYKARMRTSEADARAAKAEAEEALAVAEEAKAEVHEAHAQAQQEAAKAEEASQEAARVTAVLVDRDKFIEELRQKPRYLTDFEWSRLEKTIDKVYDGWCAALRNSGVSDGGIRTAICMKLRFSNPDSAALLGISPSSFVKAKQRLKGRLPE